MHARRLTATAALEEALNRALRRVDAGDWHGAHEIVQQHEGDARADWIHAVLHRIEGDLGNARYWYRRCGQNAAPTESPRAELARISDSLSGKMRRAAARRRGTAQ